MLVRPLSGVVQARRSSAFEKRHLLHGMFFFSSRRRHTRYWRDWSSDVCSSDLDGGAVTLQRPVVPGFHPDPSVCRVGDTYYLATSSFEYAPGVPTFRSTDLRSWELVGHALHEPSQLDVSKAGPSGGIFAPTLRHHGGRFWMITTNWSDGQGQLIVHAEDAAGPWSEPVRIPAAIGIDPDLAWDDDGTCYMSWTGPDVDGLPSGIRQAAVDPLKIGRAHV